MSIDISKIFPIQAIEQGYIINGNMDVTAGFKLMLPEIFTLSDDDAENYNSQFSDAISILPEGITILKQDYHYIDRYESKFEKDDIISRSNDLLNDERPVLMHYSYIFITFSNKQLVSSTTNSFTALADYVFRRPFRTINEKIKEAENYILRFEIQLKTLKGFKVKRMDDKDLYCCLYNFVNLTYDNPIDTIGDDVLQPITKGENFFVSGKKFASIVSMAKEGKLLPAFEKAKAIPPEIFKNGIKYAPVRQRKTSYLYPIGLGLPINHILSTWIKLVDSEVLKRKLKAEKRGIGILYALGIEAAINKTNDINEYLEIDLSQKGRKACVTGVNIIIDAESEESLRKNVEIAYNAFVSLNRTIGLIENEQLLKLFFATVPGNLNENFRTFISTVDESVRYIQKETHYLSDNNGYLIHDSFGKPVLKDMWYSKLLTGNKNELWLGTSGSGKTHLLQNLNVQAYLQGEHVVIFENGHSCKTTCKILKGKYFDSANRDSMRYNIFLCRKNARGKYIYQYDPLEFDGDSEGMFDKVNFIYSVLATIWKKGEKLEPEEQEIIKLSITKFYDHINENNLFPCIKEYFEYLDYFEKKILKTGQKGIVSFEKFKLMLEPFVTGRYSYLFDTKENIDIVNDRFVVFDLEYAFSADQDLFKYLGLIAVELMLDKERRCLTAKKRYTIDEGVDFILAKETGDHVGGLYRKGRKKTTKTIFATQTISFLESAPELIKNSIMHNSAILVLFNNDELKKMYPDLKKYLSITEEEIDVLESITHESNDKFREFFLKMGNVSRVYRNEVSAEANAIFDSRIETIDKISKLFEETGSMHSAIKKYVSKFANLN